MKRANEAWLQHEMQSEMVRSFLRFFHGAEKHEAGWTGVRWKGCVAVKMPTDLWMVQEIVREREPEVIVETGTEQGGSALFYADLGVDVITLDTREDWRRPGHPRITYLAMDSGWAETRDYVSSLLRGRPTMVILDSDHTEAHVTKELALYAPLVTPGQYLIVEDTWLDGVLGGAPGPTAAVAAFLPQHPEFRRDVSRERFFLTMHPGGWLERIA